MLPSIDFESVRSYSALPELREIIANGGPGFLMTDVPTLFEKNELGIVSSETAIRKSEVHGGASTARASSAIAVMTALHGLAHEVFKNVSHALELPWEKYLGEMHEFAAEGNDELRFITSEEEIPNKWSTVTLISPIDRPAQFLVIFGEALSVFADGLTPVPGGTNIRKDLLSDLRADQQHRSGWLVYYIRPNEDVLYTRTAGALMPPLSSKEVGNAVRVRDLKNVSVKI